MEPAAWTLGREYLCTGVSWRIGEPCLEVIDVHAGSLLRVPLMGRRLGLRPGTTGAFCTGRYGFVGGTGIELVWCPTQDLSVGGGQCERCKSQDEFRFAHHYHAGGYAPDALVRYMSQSHWVYLATFADGSSKVGTASDVRMKSRLDEQGAVVASYVAKTSDGRQARIVEDLVTHSLDVNQFRRRTAKVAALADPAPLEYVEHSHHSTVDRARDLLARSSLGPHVTPLVQEWSPPAEMAKFRNAPTGGWARYPHDLLEGTHGFYVDACAGPAILARTEPGDDALQFVVDIGGLKGYRIIAGEFVSPESAIQTALF